MRRVLSLAPAIAICGTWGCLQSNPDFGAGETAPTTESTGVPPTTSSTSPTSAATGDDPSTSTTGSLTTGTTDTGGSTDTTGSTTGCENGSIEICNGRDDDCDGLIDEVSDENTSCMDCTLVQVGERAWYVCVAELAWLSARNFCLAHGSDLISIHDMGENAAVAAYFGSGIGYRIWIGLNDIAVEGAHVWSDGTATDFFNWYPGEPNDQGMEDCIELRDDDTEQWNDQRCNFLGSFVCAAPHVL